MAEASKEPLSFPPADMNLPLPKCTQGSAGHGMGNVGSGMEDMGWGMRKEGGGM